MRVTVVGSGLCYVSLSLIMIPLSLSLTTIRILLSAIYSRQNIQQPFTKQGTYVIYVLIFSKLNFNLYGAVIGQPFLVSY